MPPITLQITPEPVKGYRVLTYDGPIPRVGERIELFFDDGYVTVVVESVVHRANGPHDSSGVRIVLTAIRARVI